MMKLSYLDTSEEPIPNYEPIEALVGTLIPETDILEIINLKAVDLPKLLVTLHSSIEEYSPFENLDVYESYVKEGLEENFTIFEQLLDDPYYKYPQVKVGAIIKRIRHLREVSGFIDRSFNKYRIYIKDHTDYFHFSPYDVNVKDIKTKEEAISVIKALLEIKGNIIKELIVRMNDMKQLYTNTGIEYHEPINSEKDIATLSENLRWNGTCAEFIKDFSDLLGQNKVLFNGKFDLVEMLSKISMHIDNVNMCKGIVELDDKFFSIKIKWLKNPDALITFIIKKVRFENKFTINGKSNLERTLIKFYEIFQIAKQRGSGYIQFKSFRTRVYNISKAMYNK